MKTPEPSPRPLSRRLGPIAVLALALGVQFGCGREFYRQWANQDASEAVFEKSRDPRFRLDMFSDRPPGDVAVRRSRTTRTSPPRPRTTAPPRRSRRRRSGPRTACSSPSRGRAISTCSRTGSGERPEPDNDQARAPRGAAAGRCRRRSAPPRRVDVAVPDARQIPGRTLRDVA